MTEIVVVVVLLVGAISGKLARSVCIERGPVETMDCKNGEFDVNTGSDTVKLHRICARRVQEGCKARGFVLFPRKSKP